MQAYSWAVWFSTPTTTFTCPCSNYYYKVKLYICLNACPMRHMIITVSADKKPWKLITNEGRASTFSVKEYFLTYSVFSKPPFFFFFSAAGVTHTPKPQSSHFLFWMLEELWTCVTIMASWSPLSLHKNKNSLFPQCSVQQTMKCCSDVTD